MQEIFCALEVIIKGCEGKERDGSSRTESSVKNGKFSENGRRVMCLQ